VDGDAVSSTFAAGQNASFTVAATAGQRLRVSVPSSTVGIQYLTLTAPDGTKVVNASWASAGSVFIVESAQAGTYTVLLDPYGTYTGVTSVKVEAVTDLTPATIAVDGAAVSSTFASGQNATLTFTTTAGQKVLLSIPSSTVGIEYLTLTAPDGTKQVTNWGIGTGSSRTLTLAQGGTWTILLDPSGAYAGATSVALSTAT
jgi:hypothetical protein